MRRTRKDRKREDTINKWNKENEEIPTKRKDKEKMTKSVDEKRKKKKRDDAKKRGREKMSK